MSFRITARDYQVGEEFNGRGELYHQLYGNHDFPEELRRYLISKGVELDGDGCFRDFEITNIQEFLEVMLEIHYKQVEDDTYWDFKPGNRYKTDTPDGLISYLGYKLDAAIVLTMYNFYQTFVGSIETYWDDADNEPKYKLKDGKKIYLSGF